MFTDLFEKKIINSDKFRPAALAFIESGRVAYTHYPVGTPEYEKFWLEEQDRCINGYTAADGDWISGYYYFYLNYCPIQQTETVIAEDHQGNKYEMDKRTTTFPLFFDYDYYFFMAVEKAERERKHLCVLKSRRKGYSYKCGSMMARNFCLIRGAKSYAYASGMQFLTGDGILTKAFSYLDHIDNFTEFRKRRGVVDTKTHKRASYRKKNRMGNVIEMGYGSEIIGESISSDPDKVRGKAGKLILFEEAGTCPELKAAWNIARPSVETDGRAWGLMIAFGTGGSEDSDFGTLKEMFYNPDAYNMVKFDNIWDEGTPDKQCSFFVPQYANMQTRDANGKRMFMDDDGNTLTELAKEEIARLRKPVIDNAVSTAQIDAYVAENCITPMEACLEVSSNIFPKRELQEQLSFIRTHEAIASHKQAGELYIDPETSKIKWKHTPGADITKYNLNREDDPTGAIAIWEHPEQDPPHGLYIAGIDPYDHDSSSTDSLGCIIIYKRMQGFESYYDLPVAEYTGRPMAGADAFYENVKLLLMYYNATALYENQNKGLLAYFRNNYCDYLLADQPDVIKDVLNTTSVNRGKGLHMTEGIKDWGETLIRDWLVEEYAPGKRNLTKILSEPLLEELIAFNRKRGNFDRIMAFMMVMIYRVQLHELHVKQGETEKSTKRKLFFEPLFRNY